MRKAAERRSKILQILDDSGQVSVSSLSEAMNVSEVTIRNDLDKLEKSQLLVRAHGGAFKTNNLPLAVSEKKGINVEAKRAIGKKAISIIREDDSIILDSGTTTFEISNNLGSFQKLTVVSNALDIISNLCQYKNVQVLVPGGFLKEFSMSLVGPMAERNFRQLNCNKLFIGIDGVKPNVGIFTHHIEEAYLNQIMIEIAEEVIVVGDSSKFLKSGLAFIEGFHKVDRFITDSGIRKEDIAMLEKNNVEVIIAD